MRRLACFESKTAWRWLIAIVGLAGASPAFGQASPPAQKPEPGLIAAYTASESGKATDTTIASNVWLYVPAGKSPTPFLPGGKFTADWEGLITMDKPAGCAFQAEVNGGLKVEVNGQVALETATDGATAIGNPVAFNRGPNILKVHFTSPAQGDAFVRLSWKPKGGFLQPIPGEALGHQSDTPELKQAKKLHLGRELFAEYRCVKCHTGPAPDSAMPELTMDAPAFDGIGSRRNYAWMARWIADPKASRAVARMPKLLHGTNAKGDAEAVASYLASLKTDAPKPAASEPTKEQAEAGKKLFETLHCEACHNPPDSTAADERKIFLNRVLEKFAPGSLAEFLQKPEVHYAWIRMPNFKLSQAEADELAAYLNSKADKAGDIAGPSDAATIERGKKLVQTSGCLNCHVLKLENQFSARALTNLTGDQWKQGCLAGAPDRGEKAPQFMFTAEEREALQAFGATDRAALTRHVPAEFAERQSRLLNCRECHGKVEGIPAFDTLGGKLKPEWAKAFIAGEINYKPRPWLDARMPAFTARAEALAEGLAMGHGQPPQTEPEPPIDMDAVKVGQKLVSMAGGLSCVLCHAVGDTAAAQVFNGEAAGINFAYSGQRLLRPFFEQWVTNPQLIDPSTKMPVYFDEEGKGLLADVYGGDGAKQRNAIWQYLRLGKKMPPPPSQ